MTRRMNHPLRELSKAEKDWLAKLSRATGEPAGEVTRAKQLLAVAAGMSYTKAARLTGRKSNDAVARLVARFNEQGLKAVAHKKGSGAPPTYGAAERERILREARRAPDPATDGTANWSLMTLRDALRRATDGLPKVSTYTIQRVLREAGFGWRQTRSWCETGISIRRRKDGARVKVIDVDAEAKKKLIERDYTLGAQMNLAVWTQDARRTVSNRSDARAKLARERFGAMPGTPIHAKRNG